MKLKHITHEACPVCQARAVSERQDMRHTNGDYNETRTFDCGMEVTYIAGYQREEMTGECTNDPAIIARNENRCAMMGRLRRYIGKMDMDKDYKDHVLSRLEYL